MGKKVMVIGVDGCSFNVIDPLIQAGKLPNLAWLYENGVRGTLRSTVPSSSAPAWTTFQTGMDPGKHGIFDFFKDCPEEYSHTPVNATFIRTETFWQRLSRLGRSVGLVNLLFTYPPKEINGFIVSGKQTPSETVDYTYPRPLKQEILAFEPEFQVEPFKRVNQSIEFLRTVVHQLNVLERVNTYLLQQHPTEFFMNLFSVPDVIHHPFWRHLDPSHPQYHKKEAERYRPLLEQCFQTLDDIIGKRLQQLDDETILIIMSDHGGGPVHKRVEISQWLQEHGLLSLKPLYQGKKAKALKTLKSLVMNIDAILSRYDRFGLRRMIRFATREKRQALAKETLIDWSGTKAYVGRVAQQGINCNLKGREKYGIVTPGEEYDVLRDEIISKLRELRDPQTGEKVFEGVYKREELYHGPCVSEAPDIIINLGELPYQISDKLFSETLFQETQGHEISGKHIPDGILLAYGRGIRQGQTIQGAHIRDLAPTILYAMGETVPVDMDGRVLEELFEVDVLKGNAVRYDESSQQTGNASSETMTYSPEERQQIEGRLRDLGYL